MALRKAIQSDAPFLTELMMMAMGDIVHQFIGIDPNLKNETSIRTAENFLRSFIEKENNQYSYQNCWVYVVENKIVGMANVYEGAALERLRYPVLELIKNKFQTFNELEDETEPGEYYIDTFAIYPAYRGQGFGEILLNNLIKTFVFEKKQVLGLLVDTKNEKAQKLYKKLGFQFVKYKMLVGNKLAHLQYQPNHG